VNIDIEGPARRRLGAAWRCGGLRVVGAVGLVAMLEGSGWALPPASDPVPAEAPPVSPTTSGDTPPTPSQKPTGDAKPGDEAKAGEPARAGGPAKAGDETQAGEQKAGTAETQTGAGATGSAETVGPAPSTDTASPDVCVGQGYHAFDQYYLLFGPNLQFADDSRAIFQNTIIEWELSFVPPWLISNQLLWMGAWASFGTHGGRNGAWRRTGVGGEFGYRFFAADVGYVYDQSLGDHEHGVRFRVGAALTMELFTGAEYRRSCCHEPNSDTICECDRTAAGVSIFPYWAIEAYPVKGEDPLDGMFGISVKLALGL
jgi:hypothetical protein